MRYIGFDLGDGESAVAAFEPGSGIEPIVLPIGGARSVLSAVGMRQGEIVIGERAYTDALADALSVRFKSRFTVDAASYEDIVRFVRGVLQELAIGPEDRFIVGCPAGWNAACRARYRELLIRAGMAEPQVISESRAAFLYAKYARTVALDIDILNQSALVADIGSSTLDYAYIVDGRETGIGTFGETVLGGGILDAAILRRAVLRSRDREAIEAVFGECRSWYSYCEIEARRLKEEYFTRLGSEPAPSVKKQLRICYDGVQKIALELNNEEMEALINEPLANLGGASFVEALRQSLENARRITADHPPKLMLLTGGASRMPFFRELCQEISRDSVVVSCPEPEFSIAKGLAYAGKVDDNLRAFRRAIEEEVSDERVRTLATEALPPLLPSIAHLLTDLVMDEATLPMADAWQSGRIRTLQEMNDRIAERTLRVLDSPLAQQVLAPAVDQWLTDIEQKLQALINPICDRYDVPRTQMQLNLVAGSAGHVNLSTGEWTGLTVAKTVLSVIVTVATGTVCGGGGLALVAAGPLGFAAGAVIGVIASLLGWNVLSGALMKAELPAFLRFIPLRKSLQNEKPRMEKQLLAALSDPRGTFIPQMADGLTQSLRSYLTSIAQAAEIPIES